MSVFWLNIIYACRKLCVKIQLYGTIYKLSYEPNNNFAFVKNTDENVVVCEFYIALGLEWFSLVIIKLNG